METKSKTPGVSAGEDNSGFSEVICSVELKTGLVQQEEFSTHELQEIISHTPHWIVRKGIVIIGFILLSLLALASFIQYPDHIAATMKIISTNPSVKIGAPCEGRLEKLWVANGSVVKKNQPVASIQGNGLHVQVSEIHKNIIVSPEEGIIQYEIPLQENQHIRALQNLFYVEPAHNSFYGKLIISQAESGRIKKGQTVIVKLEKYPSSAYGCLVGAVSYTSPLPDNENSCAVYIALPTDERSSYNKILPYENNLTARVEIITGNHKLLEKIVTFGNPLAGKH